MKKQIFTTALLSAVISASAANAPLWLRNTAISPDGQKIAFTYKGNIFTVPTKGGDASQLTTGRNYNSTPIWSPDGKSLAFTSDREGSTDIFIIDANGGTPRRLTTNSGNESPLGFLDNNTIIYQSGGMPDAKTAVPWATANVYQVKTDGSRPTLFSSVPMLKANADSRGRVLYQDRKGVENIWRKHEHSSATGDIWLIDADGRYTRLTDYNGMDAEPVWGNGDSYYYLNDKDGTLNVYSATIGSKETRQLTNFKKHPVRSLSAASDGTLAFSWDGEIYTMAPGKKPAKVNVNIVADEYVNAPVSGIQRSGITNLAVSPDGSELAFILNGDVYVTSTEYATTRRITDTAAQERSVEFAPDGRSIVYDSDRDGIWQLFTAEIKNPDEKSMVYAEEIVEKPLYKSNAGKPAFFPAYSPDGKKVAFLEDRTELRVIDLKSKKVNTALDGKYNYSYSDGDVSFSWSPDSRWLLTSYIGIGGWNNVDIAAVRADGSEVIDLTESGYSDGNPQWAMDGKAVAWASGKYGYRSHGSWGNENDVMIMFLDGEAWDRYNYNEEDLKLADKREADKKKKEADEKAKKEEKNKKKKKDADKKDSKDGDKKEADKKKDEVKPLNLDFANRRYRTDRLTPASSRMGSFFVSPKADKLYYTAPTQEGYNLYMRDLKTGDVSSLMRNIRFNGWVADKKGENLYVISGGGIQKVNLASGKPKGVSFEAEVTPRKAEQREYIFDHMWRQVLDKFYDKNLHGVDWAYYRDAYRKFLPYINNNQDFAILLSEILGELNASHTGGSYRAGSNTPSTAYLGAFFDESYNGDGLRIAEVINRGPLATAEADVQAGDIITAINGTSIKAGQDYFPLLAGKSGRKVRLDIRKADGSAKTITMRPISASANSSLLYDRWVERNEAVVDSVSGGRIGYVHIAGMDSPSYRNAYDRILGKYRNCDAVIVDTRYNGGGWLHNDIAQLLSGKEYVRYSPRGRYIGSDPFSQWTKPSALLVSEANYSDAHGTPYVYKTLGIGDIIGAPVPGTMTAVWWETQIDPSIVFGIPQVTSLDRNGKPLENQQLEPDVLIINDPNKMLQGIDEQLIGATKHLMQKTSKK